MLFPVFAITDSAAVDNLEHILFHNFGSYIWGRLLELWLLGQREKAQVVLLDITKPSPIANGPFWIPICSAGEWPFPQSLASSACCQTFGVLPTSKIRNGISVCFKLEILLLWATVNILSFVLFAFLLLWSTCSYRLSIFLPGYWIISS